MISRNTRMNKRSMHWVGCTRSSRRPLKIRKNDVNVSSMKYIQTSGGRYNVRHRMVRLETQYKDGLKRCHPLVALVPFTTVEMPIILDAGKEMYNGTGQASCSNRTHRRVRNCSSRAVYRGFHCPFGQRTPPSLQYTLFSKSRLPTYLMHSYMLYDAIMPLFEH